MSKLCHLLLVGVQSSGLDWFFFLLVFLRLFALPSLAKPSIIVAHSGLQICQEISGLHQPVFSNIERNLGSASYKVLIL